MKGGPLGHGHDKNELFFRGACGSNDLARLTIVVANYMFEPSFTNHLPHLEGKTVFGFAKQLVDYIPGAKNDSHHLDSMNFSCPRVTVLTIVPKNVEDVHMQQTTLWF